MMGLSAVIVQSCSATTLLAVVAIQLLSCCSMAGSNDGVVCSDDSELFSRQLSKKPAFDTKRNESGNLGQPTVTNHHSSSCQMLSMCMWMIECDMYNNIPVFKVHSQLAVATAWLVTGTTLVMLKSDANPVCS